MYPISFAEISDVRTPQSHTLIYTTQCYIYNHLVFLKQEIITFCYFCLYREEPIDYGTLEASIREFCGKLGLKDVDGFVGKCIQLYETTVVRHGLMLVGPCGSGKTMVSNLGDYVSNL